MTDQPYGARVFPSLDAVMASLGGQGALHSTEGAGVWITYYADWSGWSVHATELDALRYAVANHCQAGFLPYGADHTDVIDITEKGLPR